MFGRKTFFTHSDREDFFCIDRGIDEDFFPSSLFPAALAAGAIKDEIGSSSPFF